MHIHTSHLRHFTNTFGVTPLALHMRHLSSISDGIGQCLLLQTSSLARCDSTLVFCLMALVLSILFQLVPTYSLWGYIKNLYVKFSYPHTRNEECSYWEWAGVTDEKTIFSSTIMFDVWWSNCWPFCHPYPHGPYDSYNPSQFAALWLISLIAEITFHWGSVNIHQCADVSNVPPQYCCQDSPGSYAYVSPFQFWCLQC